MARQSKPWFRRSQGTWYATLDGRKVSLGVRGEENAKEARQAWHRLMSGLQEQKAKPKPVPTVGEVIRRFLADAEARMKPKTLRMYRYFLRPFAKRHGGMRVEDLTPVLVEGYSRGRGWSDSTRNTGLGAVATAFRWAVKARLLASTPLAGLERPPIASRGADTVVSPEEHERLMQAATPAFALFLRVLYGTGARPGEVRCFTAETFNAGLGIVRLRQHKSAHKGKSRVIYLTPEIVALLSGLAERYPQGPLLRNCKGLAWTENAVVKAMILTRRRAGIGHAICYGYRHGFATDALANGVPDAQVAELLGHSGTAMLHRHYSHLTARAKTLKSALGMVR
jgi:integrase